MAFHLPHVGILGTNHCGKMRRKAFKRRELSQDILWHCDYAERIVARFANKIKSEYYGENISMSIEGIKLENFSALTKSDISSTTLSRQRHAVFNSLFI